jgi:hypothetical protein
VRPCRPHGPAAGVHSPRHHRGDGAVLAVPVPEVGPVTAGGRGRRALHRPPVDRRPSSGPSPTRRPRKGRTHRCRQRRNRPPLSGGPVPSLARSPLANGVSGSGILP